MIQLVEMDANVPLAAQMEEAEGGGPVILVNRFDVAEDDADRFLKTWGEDAQVMQRQPGFISTQLHRGIAGSTVYLNYAVWESVAAFRAAFSRPEFRAALGNYPDGAVTSPHLFRKVAVPGVCIA